MTPPKVKKRTGKRKTVKHIRGYIVVPNDGKCRYDWDLSNGAFDVYIRRKYAAYGCIPGEYRVVRVVITVEPQS